MRILLVLPLTLFWSTPSLAFGSGQPGEPDIVDEESLAAMPAPSADRLWVQVRQPVSLRDLSRALQLESSTLAELNDVELSHRFDRGDWVVLPSKQFPVARQLPQLDASQLRRTPPPLMAPAPVQTTGVVRLGETLLQVAQRYGTTMQELVRLNPGLKTAGLVAGTEVQLVQSAQPRQRAVLGLRPSTSGGLSWPELPQPAHPPNREVRLQAPPPLAFPPRSLPVPPKPFHRSADELARAGILSPGELRYIRTGVSAAPVGSSAHQSACSSGALSEQECRTGIVVRGRAQDEWPVRLYPPVATVKPLSPNEQALLQRIRNDGSTPQWRTYGQCNYDWAGWKLHANGTRTTAADCGGSSLRWSIGVSCSRLLVTIRYRNGSWSKWERPSGSQSKFRRGEEEMVAALCANVKPPIN